MALGRGLGALIPEKQQSATPQAAVMLDVTSIRDNPLQPRQDYDEQKLAELMDSIDQQGMLQPIVVRKAGENYEVIAGERRLKAARKLGLAQVPAVIREAQDKQMLVMALVENLQREELNAMERAESYLRLVEEFGLKQDEVAKAVGKERVTVTNIMRLVKLPQEIKSALREGKLSEGHARALLSVDDDNLRMMLFVETLDKGLSVRDIEERAKQVAPARRRSAKRNTPKDPEIVSLENELRQCLGTRVLVENTRKNKGRLVIEYYSLNDLDRILGVIRK